MRKLYLASQSPRRRELLKQLGIDVELVHVQTDESVLDQEKPADYVLRVSKSKATVGWREIGKDDSSYPVLAADTAVIIDNKILGKPEDFVHAKAMWKSLSGREHSVLSAVVIKHQDIEHSVVQESKVRMRKIQEAEMEAYWETGEPKDKAGGYAVQGLAACFIEHISGSYSGIMGLPLYETAQILQHFQINVLTK